MLIFDLVLFWINIKGHRNNILAFVLGSHSSPELLFQEVHLSILQSRNAILCHIITAVDGLIVGNNFLESEKSHDHVKSLGDFVQTSLARSSETNELEGDCVLCHWVQFLNLEINIVV